MPLAGVQGAEPLGLLPLPDCPDMTSIGSMDTLVSNAALVRQKLDTLTTGVATLIVPAGSVPHTVTVRAHYNGLISYGPSTSVGTGLVVTAAAAGPPATAMYCLPSSM